MRVPGETYPSKLTERVPEAVDKLDDCSIRLRTDLNKVMVTEVIVRARVEDSLVTFSRAQIQDRLDQYTGSKGTIHNRLKELVNAGLLSVDTTGSNYEFTLAVPLAPPAVSLETWWSDLESFTPTDLDEISKQLPTHADIPTDGDDCSELPWGTSLPTDHWLSQQLPNTDQDVPAVAISGSQSTNQYAEYATTAWLVTVPTVVLAIVTVYPLGYPLLGLIFLSVGFAAFSVSASLLLFSYITTTWKDPVDVRPSDFKGALQDLVYRD